MIKFDWEVDHQMMCISDVTSITPHKNQDKDINISKFIFLYSTKPPTLHGYQSV